jgi:2-polyprenyl-3-methyl-5-hydroxy-6-metoxy-1,4-benzoquinol methylase
MAKAGLKTHFNLTPAEYERHRGGHLEDRRRRLVEQLVVMRAAPGATVLELGCGPGRMLARLAAARPDVTFLGLDVEPKMIEYARSHHLRENVSFDTADVTVARPAVVADAAFSIDLLHHVPDLRAFVASVRALLRPGATWLVIEPNLFHPFIFWSQARMRRAGFDEDHFRPWQAEPEFLRAGFVVQEKRYAFFFPGWLERVPQAIRWLEPTLERFRLLGGSVVYRLKSESQ